MKNGEKRTMTTKKADLENASKEELLAALEDPNFEAPKETEEEESEELETEEEVEDESDEDESDDEESEDEEEETETAEVKKLKKKAYSLEKRVSNLTARLKSKDEQVEDAREQLEYFREQTKTGTGEQFKDLPAITVGSKSIYAASDEEIESGIAWIESQDWSVAEKRKHIRMIERNLAVFKDRQARAEKLADDQEVNIERYQWGKVEEALVDPEEGVPELKPFLKEIWDWCVAEMDAKPYLKTKLVAGGEIAKAELGMKAIRALGIDKKIEATRTKSRPTPGAPVGLGKGSRGLKANAGSPKKFTEESIEKMSFDEFEKNKPAIKAFFEREQRKSRKA